MEGAGRGLAGIARFPPQRPEQHECHEQGDDCASKGVGEGDREILSSADSMGEEGRVVEHRWIVWGLVANRPVPCGQRRLRRRPSVGRACDAGGLQALPVKTGPAGQTACQHGRGEVISWPTG